MLKGEEINGDTLGLEQEEKGIVNWTSNASQNNELCRGAKGKKNKSTNENTQLG